MTEPKILFADNGPIITQHVPASAPAQTVLIHGIPIAISPGVGDILAAFHMGFEKAKDMYLTIAQPPPPAPVFLPSMGQEEEDEVLGMPRGLSPMARAAWYEAHGVQPPPFVGEDRPEDHPAYKQMEEEMGEGMGENKE